MRGTIRHKRVSEAQITSQRYLCPKKADGTVQVNGYRVVALFVQLCGRPAEEAREQEANKEMSKLVSQNETLLHDSFVSFHMMLSIIDLCPSKDNAIPRLQ